MTSPELRRIAVVNKFFHANAGAETVFFLERELLKRHGHDVVDFAMSSPKNDVSEYSKYFAKERKYEGVSKPEAARHALASVYSVDARRRFGQLLRDVAPDVVHMHNIYHQLTLSIVDAARAQGIPTVLTLHDYKIGCPSYELYRGGKICHDCVSGSPVGVVKHSCVKGSRAASAIAFVEAKMARMRRLYDDIDVLIAPSEFMASVAADAGFDPERVRFIPNFLPESELDQGAVSEDERPPTFVFAGRLEEVKGVREITQMFADGQVPGLLRILGDGPLRDEIRGVAERSPAVEFVGRVSRAQVREEYLRARAALFPSLWEENCPMSLLEARAAGAVPICSDHGGLPSFVSHGVDGLLAKAGDPRGWIANVRSLVERPAYARELAAEGHRRLLRDHAPDPHYRDLLEAYQQAMGRRK